jgi:hypothetical protein
MECCKTPIFREEGQHKKPVDEWWKNHECEVLEARDKVVKSLSMLSK